MTGHGTNSLALRDEPACDLPVSEIAAMKRRGQAPSHAALFDAALIEQVHDLYRDDAALYGAQFGTQRMLFS